MPSIIKSSTEAGGIIRLSFWFLAFVELNTYKRIVDKK